MISTANPLNLGPIVYGLFAFLVVFGALMGLWRGLKRQAVRTGTILLSLLITFLLSSLAYSYMDDQISNMTMQEIEQLLLDTGIFSYGSDLSWLENFDAHTLHLIIALPFSLILMPIVFVLCFVIISLLMLIVHAIVCAICGFKSKKNTWKTRLIGMGIGFVQGVIVSGVILLPIVGISSMAEDTVAILQEEAPDAEFTKNITEGYEAYVESVADNAVVSIYDSIGIGALYDNVSTVKINGKTHSITNLLPDVTRLALEASELSDADFEQLSAEDEKTVVNILDIIENNSYLSEILAGTVRGFAGTNIKINLKDTLDEPYLSIVADAVAIFKTSDSKNIHTDLDTIVDVYFILSRDGVIKAVTEENSDAILDILTKRDENGSTTVNKVIDTLNNNDRTKPLVSAIAKISVTVMSDSIGITEEALEVYENIKTSINEDILSIKRENYSDDEAGREEYVADISDSLDNLLRENSIELDKPIVDTMSGFIADNFSGIEELTDEGVSEIILNYYDAYIDFIENGTIPDDIPTDIIPDIDLDDLPDNLGDLIP